MNRLFWQAAREELYAGRSVFLAFVAACGKGSPGTPQSSLLVKEDGSQVGTIGGGIMEKQLIESAVKALRKTRFDPCIQKIAHRKDSTSPSGLICGGWQQNALLKLSGEADLRTTDLICQHLESHGNGLITVSNKGISFTPDTELPSQGRNFEVHKGEWTLELNLIPTRRISIFGAGHCGLALANQMSRIGFFVSLHDDRSIERAPQLNPDVSFSSASAAKGFVSNFYDWETRYAIVMTHSYPSDLSALKELLPVNPRFIGVMGSPPKLRKIVRELREIGIPQEMIDQIHAPVGLPIGSDTPEEIAVSAAAQILQDWNASNVHEYPLKNYATA